MPRRGEACTCRLDGDAVVDRCYAASHPFTGPLHVDGVRLRALLDRALTEVEAALKADAGPWIDRQGDVWERGEDGLLTSEETAPFTRAFVEKKWGPLRPVVP